MANKVQKYYLASLFMLLIFSCFSQTELRVLQFNIWQEGTVVEGGFHAIVDEIVRLDADLVALSEVRNYNETSFNVKLIEALKARGHIFYAERSEDSGILSRYPIKEQTALYPVQNDQGSITKAIIDVDGIEVAFYSAHLDYRNCSLYLPRGYDGSTWQKLNSNITDTSVIAADNLTSKRDEAQNTFLTDARLERKRGRIIIYGGDFNEPSHLDWTEATRNLHDHNGVVMQWQNTRNLEKEGFIDAYRQKYPNPLTHPGFTFPADNPLVDINKLAWAPTADDRDRIDFIFYHKDDKILLNDIKIVGPKGDIVRNKRVMETTQDPIITPINIWPTDHKAVLANFSILKN